MADLIISIKILKEFYKLKAFKSKDCDIQIDVSIEIVKNLINLSYSISANLSHIIIPYISDILAPKSPKGDFLKLRNRKDDLWKNTCFEFFLASKTKKSYIEINLSPSLDYNIYSFSDYRTDMKTDNSLNIQNIKIIQEKALFTIAFTIKAISNINIENLLVNTSTVIKYSNGKSKYYAINHNKKKADFHEKTNFIAFS